MLRQALFDVGWLQGEGNQVSGLSLGYDRCAAHEDTISGLLTRLGVDIPDLPNGIEDFKATRVPAELHFLPYTARSRDKRRKAGYSAALLLLGDLPYGATLSDPAGLAAKCGLSFWPDHPAHKDNRPRYDLQTAWDRHDLAVHARGEENVKRLQELYEALQRCDVVIATPWAKSFFRGGLSLAILSMVPQDERDAVAEKLAQANELARAARATGIEEVLRGAGKRWYALSPGWANKAKTEVHFYLNPHSQDRYNSGWFSVEDLALWAKDEGPVLGGRALDPVRYAPENKDWSIRLMKGLKEHGIHLKWIPVLCWLQGPASVPAVRLHVSSGALASGVYPFDELMRQYATSGEPATAS